MGKRGPQPKPSQILKLNGSWRADERAETELKVKPDAPEAPPWLSDEARAEWDRVIPALMAVKTVTKQDRAMLAIHCHAWGEFERAAVRLEQIETGEKPEHVGAIVDHPRVVMNRATERIFKTADRFGFCSSARARMNAAANPAGDDDKPKPKSRFFPNGPATQSG